MSDARDLMKPRIKLDPTRPGTGKWMCTSTRIPNWGGFHIVEGKGYTPQQAYLKWSRSRT